MINSNARLCMPEFPVDMFVEAVKALVKVEADWVPSEPETSLYIRPFMFATEAALGVHMASAYKFMIICCPVGAYYAEGINPVKILVEDEPGACSQGRYRIHQVRRQLCRLHLRTGKGRKAWLLPGTLAGR